MNVNVSQSFPHQSSVFDEAHYFGMFGNDGDRERAQQRQDLRSVPQVSARKFPDNKGMREYKPVFQQRHQGHQFLPEMSHPHRSVDKHHLSHGRRLSVAWVASVVFRFRPAQPTAGRSRVR